MMEKPGRVPGDPGSGGELVVLKIDRYRLSRHFYPKQPTSEAGGNRRVQSNRGYLLCTKSIKHGRSLIHEYKREQGTTTRCLTVPYKPQINNITFFM